MEQIIEKLGWKKAAIIIVGISFVFFIFVLFSIIQKNKEMGVVSNAKKETVKENDDFQNGSTDLAKKYTTEYYQISYPKSYSLTLYEGQEGILDSILLTDSNSDARVEVSVFDASMTSIADLSRIPKSLGLAKSQTSVGPFTGDSFSGVSKGTKEFENIVLFKKDNTIIKIQLMELSGPTRKGQAEFEKMLKAFQ